MKTILFIDDDEAVVRSLENVYHDYKNVRVVRCLTVKEALNAILEHRPDIIFLDHEFTRRGDEGLEVVRELRSSGNPALIYSTTMTHRDEVLTEYEKLGIELVGKTNLERIREIIEQP